MPIVPEEKSIDKETLLAYVLKRMDYENYHAEIINEKIEIPYFGCLEINSKIQGIDFTKGSYTIECKSIKEDDLFDKIRNENGCTFAGNSRTEFNNAIDELITIMNKLKPADIYPTDEHY